jgi:hypothetical protein
VRFLFVALLAAGCLRVLPVPDPQPQAEVAPPANCVRLPPDMDGPHFLARLLADACTSAPTDDDLVEHTLFVLSACKGSVTACLRKACVKLRENDPDDPHIPTPGRSR